MLAHWKIHHTGLAAAVATLGVPLDPTEPYARTIDTESGREQLTFLFAPVSETDSTRVTEHLIGFWEKRAEFEAAHPDHPLVPMRAVYDARAKLLPIIFGAAIPPVKGFKGEEFLTPHLFEAAILRAHGFPLLIFTGRAFSFPDRWKGVFASEVIENTQRVEGRTPAQWQARFLVNLEKFLAVAKSTPILAEREDAKTLLLSADATPKTRDFWHDKL